jgi:hypothetical protein
MSIPYYHFHWTDLLLHITHDETYYEITVSLNIKAIKLKRNS